MENQEKEGVQYLLLDILKNLGDLVLIFFRGTFILIGLSAVFNHETFTFQEACLLNILIIFLVFVIHKLIGKK